MEFVCLVLCVLFLTKYVRKKVYDNFDESLKSRLKSLKIRKANKIVVKKKKKTKSLLFMSIVLIFQVLEKKFKMKKKK